MARKHNEDASARVSNTLRQCAIDQEVPKVFALAGVLALVSLEGSRLANALSDTTYLHVSPATVVLIATGLVATGLTEKIFSTTAALFGELRRHPQYERSVAPGTRFVRIGTHRITNKPIYALVTERRGDE